MDGSSFLPQPQPFHIIGLPSGALAGISQLVTLSFAEYVLGHGIATFADGLAGSSIGAMNATMLAIPHKTQPKAPAFKSIDVLTLMRQIAPEVTPTKTFPFILKKSVLELTNELQAAANRGFSATFQLAASAARSAKARTEEAALVEGGVGNRLIRSFSYACGLNPAHLAATAHMLQDGIVPVATKARGWLNKQYLGACEFLFDRSHLDAQPFEDALTRSITERAGPVLMSQALTSLSISTLNIDHQTYQTALHLKSEAGNTPSIDEIPLVEHVMRSTAAAVMFRPRASVEGLHYIDPAPFYTMRNAFDSYRLALPKDQKIRLTVFDSHGVPDERNSALYARRSTPGLIGEFIEISANAVTNDHYKILAHDLGSGFHLIRADCNKDLPQIPPKAEALLRPFCRDVLGDESLMDAIATVREPDTMSARFSSHDDNIRTFMTLGVRAIAQSWDTLRSALTQMTETDQARYCHSEQSLADIRARINDTMGHGNVIPLPVTSPAIAA